MVYQDAINRLKDFIKTAYEETYKKIKPNIYRGHLRCLSSDIEDGIAIFISELLPDYHIFLDPSINVEGKTKRPDILVVNSANEVIAVIEVKANMGYCRNAIGYIDKMIQSHRIFTDKKTIHCEFSRESSRDVVYSESTKLFLVSLTDLNCPDNNHRRNKEYAEINKVYQFNLFTGWYDSLSDLEISKFVNELA